MYDLSIEITTWHNQFKFCWNSPITTKCLYCCSSLLPQIFYSLWPLLGATNFGFVEIVLPPQYVCIVVIAPCHKYFVWCDKYISPLKWVCCNKLLPQTYDLWQNDCTYENKICCHKVLQQLTIATKGHVPRNKSCWNRLSPQIPIATNGLFATVCRLLREAISTKEIVASSACCHEKKCGNLRHRHCNITLSCHIVVFVAITYYHACCRNAWQRTQCRGNRYLLRQFATYCDKCCCCNRPESL
jgi:hypothetical protein